MYIAAPATASSATSRRYAVAKTRPSSFSLTGRFSRLPPYPVPATFIDPPACSAAGVPVSDVSPFSQVLSSAFVGQPVGVK